jgi:hypothetical protein
MRTNKDVIQGARYLGENDITRVPSLLYQHTTQSKI